MSLTFYFSPMSTSTITELVLAELGIPCERVQLDLKAGDGKKPDFLKLNPNGKVPLLVHDGTPIFESTAITMYLGDTFGVEKKLYPASGPKRGEAMKWIAWAGVTLSDGVYRWTRNSTDWTPKDQHNEKAAEAGKADMMNSLRILNEALAGKEYLCGDYTIADTHVASLVDWMGFLKVDISALSNVVAWQKRCHARPAYQKVMEKVVAAMKG